jgi:hypothetical protein
MSFARFLHSGALENPQPKSSDTSAQENESPRGTGHLNKNSKPIYQGGRTNLGGSLNRRSGRIHWTATPEVRLCHDGARTDAMFLRAKTSGVLRPLPSEQSQAGDAPGSSTYNAGAVEDASLRAHDGAMFSVCDNQQIGDPLSWCLTGT